MLKKNKGFFILTCIVIMLPCFVGLILWDKLPDQMITSFGSGGTANGYSSKFFAVVGMYVFILAIHTLCAIVTGLDPKGKNISSKIYHMILCICPLVSIWCGIMIYGNAIGYPMLKADIWANLLIGIILVIIGNYLPKCRQNYTIGIKLPWTLEDEATWDYTHRMAGKWWMIGGIIVILLGFQKVIDPIMAGVGIVLVVTLIPSIASYIYYKTHTKVL